MKSVNSKSLLEFVFNQMDRLDKKEINVQQAREQSNLIKQANNLLRYELDRAKVKIELSNHNRKHKEELNLREIETK